MGKLFRDAAGACLEPRGSVVAIGAFDGVHRGHQALLDAAGARARALGVALVALSFEPLPRQYFMGRNAIARLTTPRDKLGLLSERCDRIGLLRFTSGLAATSAERFVEQVLVQRLAAREVWVGPEFRFGHARRGDVALLAGMGAARGFSAHTVEPVLDGIERISSSRIRTALKNGDFAAAARWLGRPFAMGGHVARGKQLGRRLGYPTANLPLRHGLAPVQGIFAVRVDGAGLVDRPAVASLGTRPTVGGVEPLLEAHVFDFDGDLYGQRLEVRFVARLRDEVRFENLDALVAQMDLDAARARELLGMAPAGPRVAREATTNSSGAAT